MSVQAMSECWGPNLPMANELGLRPATIRLVALAVADVVNDAHDNEFYGSVTKLAAKVGLSRQCVGQVLKHLCDAGVLSQLEERPGGTTKYRWVGVTTTLSGSYPQPDNHADRYLTTTLSGGDNHVVTNPIEPKSEPKKTLPAAPEMSHFGSDGTEKEEKSGPAPSRVVVDHFELRWSQVVNRHKEYWSFPVVPLRAAAYTWVNSNYFRHKSLPPRPVSQVVALVDSFMQMVDTDQITPKKGYSIWQTFVANIAKLDNETVVLPEREIVY